MENSDLLIASNSLSVTFARPQEGKVSLGKVEKDTALLEERECLSESSDDCNLACETDTVAYSDALRPIAQKNPFEQIASFRTFWWNDEVEAFHQKTQQNYAMHLTECVIVPQDGRVAGDPLPFRLSADDYVCSVLLACFALSAFFIARSQHYLWIKAKEFLRTRSRENMFNDSSDERMTGKYFFCFSLCVSLGVLLFSYQQTVDARLVDDISPYAVLGVDIVGVLGAFMVRTMLYGFVNSVFFDREKNEKWMESYYLLTVAANLFFFPLAMLVVFSELDFFIWKILFSLLVIFVEIFLIFKTYRIFFNGFWGVLHLILYLCSLEILPLLTLWKGTVWVTQELTKLV